MTAINVTPQEVLERAYERIITFGWWGKDGLSRRKFSHKNPDDNCKCLALHIDSAAFELLGGGPWSLEKADLVKRSLLIAAKVVNPKEIERRGPFGAIAAWNDAPSRHVATVKRALKRAIKAAA